MLHGAGNILLPISFFGIIKTDQRIIFGYSLPHFLQGFHDQPIDDVVAADDSGAFRDALQKSFNGTDIAFVVGFVRNTPLDVIIVQFQTTISHRFRHALKLFYALVVVVHEDACNVAVSGIDQAPYQLMRTFNIIDGHTRTAQIPIKIVVEYHRNFAPIKFLVAVKIRAEDTRLNTVHDKAMKILMHHCFQTAAFVAELVIGQKYVQIHPFLCQNAAHTLNQPRICTRILTLQNKADLIKCILGVQIARHHLFPVEIGAAPFDFVHDSFIHQSVNGNSNRFPADAQLSAECIFRGQSLISRKLVFVDISQKPTIYLSRFFLSSREHGQTLLFSR